MSSQSKQLPLHHKHLQLGAKFIDFAGFSMPVWYTSALEEHIAVRTSVGIFDVSHMGEFRIIGKSAREWLDYITPNNVSNLQVGRSQYTALLNEQGGVIDDCILTCLADEEFYLCVNASNIDKDFQWLNNKKTSDVQLVDESEKTALIAIQGKNSFEVISKLFSEVPSKSFSSFVVSSSSYESVLITRTGYTGEDGFEIFLPIEHAGMIWDQLTSVGSGYGIRPCGLAARDTLRTEAALPLYGHELSEDRDIRTSNVRWIVKFDKKSDFIGKSALMNNLIPDELIGLIVPSGKIIRQGTKLFSGDVPIGIVTSGTKSPTLNCSIALAYIGKTYLGESVVIEADLRGERVECKKVQLPFYKRGK